MSESDDEEEEATRQPLYLDVVATDIPDMNGEARSEAARQLALHAGVPAEAIIFNADIASEMRKFDATMMVATALSFRDDVHDAAVEYLTTGKEKGKNAEATTMPPAADGSAAAASQTARAELEAAMPGHAVAVWTVKVGGHSVRMIVSEMGADGAAMRAALEDHSGIRAAAVCAGWSRAEEAAAYARNGHPMTVVCREVGPVAAVPKRLRGLPMQTIEEGVMAALDERLVYKESREKVRVWRTDRTRPGMKGGSMPNAIDSA